MQKVILPFIGLAALALIAPPTHAQTNVGVPQVYVGVHGGMLFDNTELSMGSSSIDGLGGQGWVGGLHGGLDIPFAKAPTGVVPFAGVFGGYDWTNAEFSISNGGTKISAPEGSSWYAGGRLGIMTASNGAKYYILGAYRDGDLDLTQFHLQSVKLQGWDAGVGAEFPLAKYVTLGVEGRYTRFGDEALTATGGGATGMTIHPHDLGVLARLNFVLGEPTPSSLFQETPADPPGCDTKLGNCPKKR